MYILKNLVISSSNDFDFNVTTQWQFLNGNTTSGWLVGGEVSTVDLVQFLEVTHIGQEDVDLDDLVQAGVTSSQDGFDVVEHLLGLVGNGAFDLLTFGSVVDLARNVKQVADLHTWRVRSGWWGGILAKNL